MNLGQGMAEHEQPVREVEPEPPLDGTEVAQRLLHRGLRLAAGEDQRCEQVQLGLVRLLVAEGEVVHERPGLGIEQAPCRLVPVLRGLARDLQKLG